MRGDCPCSSCWEALWRPSLRASALAGALPWPHMLGTPHWPPQCTPSASLLPRQPSSSHMMMLARRFLHAQTAAVSEVVAEYSAAAAAGWAPGPLPLYVERQGGSQPGSAATDVNYELLQLFVQRRRGQGRCSGQALRRLLRPAAYCPEPLDQLLGWQLLSALTAAAAIQCSPDAAHLVRCCSTAPQSHAQQRPSK